MSTSIDFSKENFTLASFFHRLHCVSSTLFVLQPLVRLIKGWEMPKQVILEHMQKSFCNAHPLLWGLHHSARGPWHTGLLHPSFKVRARSLFPHKYFSSIYALLLFTLLIVQRRTGNSHFVNFLMSDRKRETKNPVIRQIRFRMNHRRNSSFMISSERALCSLALSYVGLEWEWSCEYGTHTKLPLSGSRRFCIQPHWIQALEKALPFWN